MTPSLKHGLLAAAATAVWMLLAYAAGLHTRHIALGNYANYGAEIFLALALWRTLRAHLLADERQWLPVWRGLLLGAYTGVVAAMGVYLFLSIYLNFINPDYPDLHLEWKVAAMRAAGETEEAVRAMAREYRAGTSAIGLPLKLAGTYLIFSLVLSPILTLWLNWRRR